MDSTLFSPLSATRAPNALPDSYWSRILILGLMLLPLQMIHIGIVQPVQFWAVLVLGVIILYGQIRISLGEALTYAAFMGFALVATLFSNSPSFKTVEQLMKFGFLYPAFFLIGRALGSHFQCRALPYSYLLLWGVLVSQYLIQKLEVPYLFHDVYFMREALYGTFKERNWLAIYFFLAAYLLFLQSSRRTTDILHFAVFSITIALLSQSKTILIPVIMVVLLHVPHRGLLKVHLGVVGIAFYIWQFGDQLSGHYLQVRLEDERGLAFVETVKLISDNWLGYGFGFVEAYFSQLWFSIQGLGKGTNSVFSSPLDLMLIAGIPGFVFWLVFFAGVGLRAVALLVPIAAWSLTNPLHQSEIVYLFMGILMSWGIQIKPLMPSKPST